MHLLFLNSESIVEWLRYYFSIKGILSSARSRMTRIMGRDAI